MSFSPRLGLSLSILASLLTSAAAHADDAPPSSTPPSTGATTATQDAEATRLKDEFDELVTHQRVEQEQLKLEREQQDQREHARPKWTGLGKAQLRRGTIVLPDVLGVSTMLAMPSGGRPATGVSGPVSAATTTRPNGERTTFFGISPSADVFLTDRLTVGARVLASRFITKSAAEASVPGTKTDGYAAMLEPRVGYVIPLSHDVLLWPQASVSTGVARASVGGTHQMDYQVGTSVEAAFVFPLGKHVLASVSPVVAYAHDFAPGPAGNADRVSAGVRAHIGIAF